MALLYSLEEAAGLLGMSVPDVKNLAQSGELRAILRSGIWKLFVSEVHTYARARGISLAEPEPDSSQSSASTPVLIIPGYGQSSPSTPTLVSPGNGQMARDGSAGAIPLSPNPAANGAASRAAPSLVALPVFPSHGATALKTPSSVEVQAIPVPGQNDSSSSNSIATPEEDDGRSRWDDLLEVALSQENLKTLDDPEDEAEESKPASEPAKRDGNGGAASPAPATPARNGSPPSSAGLRTQALTASGPKRTHGANFITTRCPNEDCNAPGRISIERIDQPMRCAVCHTRFYLDPLTNEAIRGERPVQEEVVPKIDKKTYDNKVVKLFDRGVTIWSEAKPKKKNLIRLAVLCTIILLIVGWQLLGPSVRNHPEDRTNYIRDALAWNSPGRVELVTTPESTGDINEWFKKVRPSFWPAYVAEPEARVSKKLYVKGKVATYRIEVLPPSGAPDSADEPRGKSASPAKIHAILLIWECRSGTWLFNASRSLSVVTKPEEAEALERSDTTATPRSKLNAPKKPSASRTPGIENL